MTVDARDVGRYRREIESAVYFSCLEALQNVAKYSKASRVEVVLSDGDGRLQFEISDDGIGFAQDRAPRGTGLQGIVDRLAALGGRAEIRSTPGAGTTVRGELPARG
jgi:signal transduction histidine kinase